MTDLFYSLMIINTYWYLFIRYIIIFFSDFFLNIWIFFPRTFLWDLMDPSLGIEILLFVYSTSSKTPILLLINFKTWNIKIVKNLLLKVCCFISCTYLPIILCKIRHDQNLYGVHTFWVIIYSSDYDTYRFWVCLLRLNKI